MRRVRNLAFALLTVIAVMTGQVPMLASFETFISTNGCSDPMYWTENGCIDAAWTTYCDGTDDPEHWCDEEAAPACDDYCVDHFGSSITGHLEFCYPGEFQSFVDCRCNLEPCPGR